jgi:hypothetical protein
MKGGSHEIHRDVWHQLYTRGHKPKKILRVESAGDSLTGDTTVIFVNSHRQAKTAYVASQELPKKKASADPEYRLHIVVVDGWPVEIPA